MTIYAAFHKKKKWYWDALVRWRTDSIYAHCELVIVGNGVPMFYSSSPIDGGVRCKPMNIDADTWDIIPVPWVSEEDVIEHFKATKDARYDWLGVLIGQGLFVHREASTAWFCSEWVAAAMKLRKPWRYSPGTLHDVLSDMCDLYNNKSML
jgi:hypothetical protein